MAQVEAVVEKVVRLLLEQAELVIHLPLVHHKETMVDLEVIICLVEEEEVIVQSEELQHQDQVMLELVGLELIFHLLFQVLVYQILELMLVAVVEQDLQDL